MPIVDVQRWGKFIEGNDDVHILQTPGWGQLKSEYGWEAVHLIHDQVGAQILFRKLPMGLRIGYIPKGPIGPAVGYPDFFHEVSGVCRERNAVFLKVELDAWEGEASLPEILIEQEMHESKPIQPGRTLVIDIQSAEDEILARMKQKTRYNIRLAARKGVEMRSSIDIDEFYRLMDVTADRDEFGVHSKEYYQRVMEIFALEYHATMLTAYYDGEPLASIIVMLNGLRAWYFYGASSNQHRNLMPTYLLQWEGIRWAKAQGARVYDLWGIPDHDEETLEAQFTERSDGLWGVYRFKRGFGGDIRRSAPAVDLIYKPVLYQTYRQVDRMFFN